MLFYVEMEDFIMIRRKYDGHAWNRGDTNDKKIDGEKTWEKHYLK